jgi:hypothetical protein
LNDWEWLTGEAWEDTNWGCSQPGGQDGAGHSENYLHYYSCTAGQPDRIWNDIENLYHGSNPVIGFIVEWEVGSFSLDCNTNGIPDECDIADETSEDINGDGVPDECQCLADIDGSGAVTIDDILVVIGYWGSSSPAGDLNSDGIINIEDLLIIFDEWGPCP